MRTVLLNDFHAQWATIGEKILSAAERVGKSGWYILGEEVKNFENHLAAHWGLNYAVGCASGLDALEIGLRALGITPGEKVLTTPLSAFATTLAIIRAGGIPVFVDVDDSGLIDLALCEQALEKYPEIRYFVPVHLYGQVLSYTKLSELKSKYDLKIVEDCAQAIGASSEGKTVGGVGSIAATSFYPTKNLGCMGDGGALLTNEKILETKARCIRDYGQSQKYIHVELGLNSRLDELQAAILDTLIPQLRTLTKRRKVIAFKYREKIRHSLIHFPSIPDGSDGVWHLFPLLVKENVEGFQNYLKSKNIQTGRHYPLLIPRQTALQNFIEIAMMNKAQYFAEHEVSLPIHPFMVEEDIEHVIDACNTWMA